MTSCEKKVSPERKKEYSAVLRAEREMENNKNLFRSWLAGALIFGALLLSGACRKGAPTLGDPSLAFRSTKSTDISIVHDLSCVRPETVINPGVQDPEFPLAEIYRAALMPAGKKAFQRFVDQFESSKDARFLRDQQWPRIREHVRKYVQDPEDFSFQLCQREIKVDGTIKVFVRSHGERKSNPPCTLVEKGGVWKVRFFSY
jgi:hypothetical protein